MCGRLSNKMKEVRLPHLRRLFKDKCFKCGSLFPLTIDHHLPRSKGGTNKLKNLVLLCEGCNHKKNDKSPWEFYSPKQLKALKRIRYEQNR